MCITVVRLITRYLTIFIHFIKFLLFIGNILFLSKYINTYLILSYITSFLLILEFEL